MRTYSELIKLSSYDERFNYLKLGGTVAGETFGPERHLNQKFYKSREWSEIRRQILMRDNFCDIAVDGYEIAGKMFIHHMNPIRPESLRFGLSDSVLDPEQLITVSFETHQAIHYGTAPTPQFEYVERRPNDHIPWRVS